MAKVKDKERILKAAKEKQLVTYKGAPIRLSADFSRDTLNARREWHEIFKVIKSKDLQPKLLYPAKLSFTIERQIKCFQDQVKLKEFNIDQPLLYCNILKVESQIYISKYVISFQYFLSSILSPWQTGMNSAPVI